MTTTDKPEGLIAGGEQVRAKASHNTPPAEEDRGEREWEKHARVHIAQIQKRFPNRSNWVPTARYLERALAELDSLRDSPLLSSPRVEGETITPQAAIDEVENAFLAVASKDLPLLRDIRKRLRALGIRSLSPQGE